MKMKWYNKIKIKRNKFSIENYEDILFMNVYHLRDSVELNGIQYSNRKFAL